MQRSLYFMNPKELKEIIERIERGVATDHDLSVYNHYCRIRQKQGSVLNEDFLNEKEKEIFLYVDARIKQTQRKRKILFIQKVAAAVLLLASLSFVLWNLGKNKNVLKEVQNSQLFSGEEIKPGKTAGVLILSDGRTIDLLGDEEKQINDLPGKLKKDAKGVLSFQNSESLFSQEDTVGEHALITAKGQQFQFILPDGTQVWLNADSKITFPSTFINADERAVKLEGEAYFDVMRNEDQPFLVQTDKQLIQVLGTQFNVNSYQEENITKTTVVEGAVLVNHNLRLKPGEQARTNARHEDAKVKANIEAEISWQKGYFEFDEENIYQIMRKLSRWYNVEVEFGENMPEDVMKGRISKFESVDKVLGIISQTDLVRFKIESRTIYVFVP